MPGTLALERFDLPERAAPTMRPADTATECAAAEQAPPTGSAQEEAAAAAARAERAAAEAAAEAEAAAAARAIEAGLAGLAATLATEERAAWRSALACLAEAVAALAPRLAEERFAADAARAVSQLLDAAGPPEAVLLHAPADGPPLAEAVDSLGGDAAPGLVLREEPALAPGTLRLDWPDGTARLDREALAESLTACLAAALDPDTCNPETTP